MRPTEQSVEQFLAHIDDPQKRADSMALVQLLEEVTGEPPVMWGTIVGFGKYHYRYASGHEGDSPLTAFAPRTSNLTLYLSCDLERYSNQLRRLGKHSSGKCCLYVKRLSDVDRDMLRELVTTAVEQTKTNYGVRWPSADETDTRVPREDRVEDLAP